MRVQPEIGPSIASWVMGMENSSDKMSATKAKLF